MLDVAIVSLGSWGRKLLESIQGKSDRIRVVKVISRDPSHLADYATEKGFAVTDDYDAVLADPAIPAVVVCGPNLLHAGWSLQALEAGKHVLAIKPMALELAEAERLREAAMASGVQLCVGYNRCFLQPIQELRRRIAAGALGELLHAEGDFCAGRYFGQQPGEWKASNAQHPAGVLGDHILYPMIEFLGPVAEVHTMGARLAAEVDLPDTTAVLMRFKGGQSGAITAIGVTADYTRLQVFGTAGWAEVRGADSFTFKPMKGETETITFPPFDAERAEMEAFADAVTDAAPFPVPLDQAVQGVAVIEAMARSAKEDKPIILG